MKHEYAQGAANAVRRALNVRADDRVAVIKGHERADISNAIEEEAAATGAEVRGLWIDDYIPRPATSFPDSLHSELLRFRPSASFYIAESMPGELRLRLPLMHLLKELGSRHGHMVGIEPRMMWEGLAADYDEIYRITHRVTDAVRSAGTLEVTSPSGTDLTVRLSADTPWFPCDGRYHEPASFGNLPEGETFTVPALVDGVLAGEVLGDHFSSRYGILEQPIRFRVRAGRVEAVEMPGRPDIQSDVEDYLSQDPNSSRVGEFAIGTNVALQTLIGNMLQDEKIPGIHVAFGDPLGHVTGVEWTAPTHVDVVATRATVLADGQSVLKDGRFLV